MACEAKPLRFPIGAEVFANRGKWVNGKFVYKWVKGKIIAHWNMHRAYRIQLKDWRRTEVWANIDDDHFVKAECSLKSDRVCGLSIWEFAFVAAVAAVILGIFLADKHPF